MTTEVSTTEDAALARLETLTYGSTLDIEAFLEKADVVAGRKLLAKSDLVGVPLAITSVTFRPGIGGRDYVSVECTDMRNRIDCVINDGSTGIRRQIVQYLQAKGQLSATLNPDLPIATEADSPTFELAWCIMQGLRVSQYDNGNGDSETWYLAV